MAESVGIYWLLLFGSQFVGDIAFIVNNATLLSPSSLELVKGSPVIDTEDIAHV